MALLPARAAEAAGIAAMALAGLLALWLLAGLADAGPARDRPVFVLGLVVLPVWAQVAVHWAHPDDVLAVLAALAALRLLRSGRWAWAALALAAAADSKPWALVSAPLVLLAPGRCRLRAAAVHAAGVLLVRAPFWLADPAGIGAAGRYRIPVSPSSVIHLLGVRDTETPPWCRTAQLLLGLALVAAAVARRRWSVALLAGVSARMLLDPATKTYYDSSLVLAAAVWNLAAAPAVPDLTLARACSCTPRRTCSRTSRPACRAAAGLPGCRAGLGPDVPGDPPRRRTGAAPGRRGQGRAVSVPAAGSGRRVQRQHDLARP